MSLIGDISAIVGSSGDISDGDIESASRMFGKLDAITKKAKKGVHSYPVILSEAVAGSDEDLTLSIVSYLEAQYAIFTTIAMGLNPQLDKSDKRITSHLDSVYYSGESDTPLNMIGVDENVTMTVETDLKVTVPEGTYDTYSIGMEADDDDKEKTAFKSKLENKMRNQDPTIIQIDLRTSTGKVTIPIAVKASAHIIDSEESKQIFSYLKDDKPIVQLVKFLSGEITLFKDIIFQIKKAKGDKDLYKKLGRHPWFRALTERRASRKRNAILSLIPKLKKVMGGKYTNDVYPVCTLVVTKEELESGYGKLWSHVKKESESIMDKMMLLCICVVDTDANVVEFDFYGLKNNFIFRGSDLISTYSNGKGKTDADMGKILEKLISKV